MCWNPYVYSVFDKQCLKINLDQIITPQKAKFGPDNNSTAHIYIYVYIYMLMYLFIFFQVLICPFFRARGKGGSVWAGGRGGQSWVESRGRVRGGGGGGAAQGHGGCLQGGVGAEIPTKESTRQKSENERLCFGGIFFVDPLRHSDFAVSCSSGDNANRSLRYRGRGWLFGHQSLMTPTHAASIHEWQLVWASSCTPPPLPDHLQSKRPWPACVCAQALCT